VPAAPADGDHGAGGTPPGQPSADEVATGHTRADEVATGHTRADEVATGHTRADEVATGHKRADEVATGHKRKLGNDDHGEGQHNVGPTSPTKVARTSPTGILAAIVPDAHMVADAGADGAGATANADEAAVHGVVAAGPEMSDASINAPSR
jgi:hypothetical protein